MIAAVLVFAFSSYIGVFAQDKTASEKKQSEVPKIKQQKDKDSYTCPMHSEVKSQQAGSCPKCKMDLVKNTTSEGKDKKEHKMKMGNGMMHDIDKPAQSKDDSTKTN